MKIGQKGTTEKSLAPSEKRERNAAAAAGRQAASTRIKMKRWQGNTILECCQLVMTLKTLERIKLEFSILQATNQHFICSLVTRPRSLVLSTSLRFSGLFLLILCTKPYDFRFFSSSFFPPLILFTTSLSGWLQCSSFFS